MTTRRLLTATLTLLLLQNYLIGQDKLNIKFGKIAPEDFDLSKYKYDTGASAVIIADIGNTSFIGNTKGDFSLVFKRHKRIKIINKNGYDIAKETIFVYQRNSDEEKLKDLKAATFNLENGKVVETDLDQKSIFTDKVDKYRSKKKFTFPAVKEGSIIDISYTIESDFYVDLRSWTFQGEYPCLWSEYQVTIPQFFHYVAVNQGDQNFAIHTSKEVNVNYSIRQPNGTERSEFLSIMGTATENRWVMKNVPPLKEESFTTTIRNHVSKITFQLHYVQFGEANERHDYMGNWFIASEKLLKHENFGQALDEDNHWMKEDLKAITTGCKNNEEKIRKIYAFVRSNFTCTDHDRLYTDNSLKTVFKKRNGNVAEINLLLVAMLRHEDIPSDPAVLSTRDNGYCSETYPMIDGFNYVICVARDNDKTFYLDASEPLMGFDHLPIDCYNGQARIINKEKPYAIYFDSDSLHERTVTGVVIIMDEKGKPSGSFQSTLGYYQSYNLREKAKKKSEKDVFKDIQTAYGSDVEISNTGIDSLDQLEYPVKIHYDFDLKNMTDDIIYFNPMMSEAYKENPFKSADRKYPVEMPYTMDELYSFSMEIPEGYVVDELPKSARVMLNDKEGMFEYLIQKNDIGIQMQMRIKLNKALFLPEDYSTLRDFFASIVKKQSEQIVLKKKK
ncbi:MAG: DUF3857 domain-containing protein [Bacteroidetes bacterium]|nr:DUF3857 domain-containing protein [Bacteroidota bacterium]